MNYQDAKAEMVHFDEGDEIIAVFRGSITKAADAAQRFMYEHPRIRRKVDYQTIRAGLKWEPIRVPIFEALVDFAGDVTGNPRAYCEPPEIPDDWEAFAERALAYATHKWWYANLKLDEIPKCKPTSFQSWLSRETAPRAWEQIRKRAIEWRSRVMQALDDWDRCVIERNDRYSMLETWVKEAFDQGGELAAMREFKRLKQYSFIKFGGWNVFDPANPEAPQFEFEAMDDDDWLPEFRECQEEGWSGYRPNIPKPDCIARYQTRRYFCDEQLEYEWESECELERSLTWDERLRCLNGPERVVRIKVKRHAREAGPNDAIHRESRFQMINGDRVEVEGFDYFWQWREVDEYDTLVNMDIREQAIRLGFAMLPEHEEVPIEMLRQRKAPIEQKDPMRPRIFVN